MHAGLSFAGPMARHLRPLVLLLLLLAQPGPALAHGNGLPWVWLDSEQVMPGGRFDVLVIDFQPFAQVELELVADEQRVTLGTIPCEGDGHGEAQLVVPADFPIGYAELTATDGAGNEAVTLLYVGEAPDGMGPPAPPERPTFPADGARPAEWWTDPSVIVLGLIVIGALAAFVVMLVRRPKRRTSGETRLSR
jgi:hypothetical protein